MAAMLHAKPKPGALGKGPAQTPPRRSARIARRCFAAGSLLSPPILEVRNLVKLYPAVTAVEGMCFGLLGPNGAGKTTTIEMMEGILEPTSGEVLYRGEPVGRRFREEAGILFQKTALQDFLTLRQTLNMFRGLYPRALDVDEV